eukprot:scaffold11828_cov112-Isochrysis_galbana.AAC.3
MGCHTSPWLIQAASCLPRILTSTPSSLSPLWLRGAPACRISSSSLSASSSRPFDANPRTCHQGLAGNHQGGKGRGAEAAQKDDRERLPLRSKRSPFFTPRLTPHNDGVRRHTIRSPPRPHAPGECGMHHDVEALHVGSNPLLGPHHLEPALGRVGVPGARQRRHDDGVRHAVGGRAQLPPARLGQHSGSLQGLQGAGVRLEQRVEQDGVGPDALELHAAKHLARLVGLAQLHKESGGRGLR